MTKSASNKGNVFKDKFTVDSELNNKNVSKFYDTVNKQMQIANDKEATEQDSLSLKYLTYVQSEISELYNEKRKIQNSNISNSEKQKKVREVQQEINTKMKNAIKTYKNVEIVDKDRNDISKIGETYYIKNEGEWKTISEKDEIRMKEIEESDGDEIDYLKYKIDMASSDEDKKKTKDKIDYLYNCNFSLKSKEYIYQNIIGTQDSDYKKYKYSGGKINEYLKFKTLIEERKEKNNVETLKQSDKIKILQQSDLSKLDKARIYEIKYDDKNFRYVKESGLDIDEYLKYKSVNIKSDKNKYGKTIYGSKKKKTLKYINSMKCNYNQRLLLLSMQYKLDSKQRNIVANYINNMKLTRYEKLELYSKLKGFKVNKNGEVTF